MAKEKPSGKILVLKGSRLTSVVVPYVRKIESIFPKPCKNLRNVQPTIY